MSANQQSQDNLQGGSSNANQQSMVTIDGVISQADPALAAFAIGPHKKITSEQERHEGWQRCIN